MSLSPSIRVLCVDDNDAVTSALALRLRLEDDLESVGHLASADDLVDEALRTRPDVVLLDIDMPGRSPFEAIDDLQVRCPSARVLMLTAYIRQDYINMAIQAGAWGYLSKSEDVAAILGSVRAVANGEFVFGEHVAATISRPESAAG